MARFWWSAVMLAGGFLIVFVVASALGWQVDDPAPLLAGGGILAAVIAVVLLIADVLAPIPASLVMIANGALFGAIVGPVISTVGAMLAFALAFALGRRSSRGFETFWGRAQRERAEALLARRGALAIAVTRPIPIIAETTAIVAGASAMPWGLALAAAATGVVPQAVVYALVGAVWASFAPDAVAFIAVVVVALLVWGLASRSAPAAEGVE